jgi:hypothetical protein
MAGPLLELAAQYEAEVKEAMQRTERECLAPIAEALSHPDCAQVKPETFTVLAAVRGAMHQLDEDHRLRESLNAKLEAFEAAEAERLRKRELGQKILADKRETRLAALDQLVSSLVALRDIDMSTISDLERAAYDRHISDIRARYGQDAAIRD